MRADRLGDVTTQAGLRPPRRAGTPPAGADGRGRPAGRDRGPAHQAGLLLEAGSGRPARAGGRRRTGRAAPAVPRAPADVGAARGRTLTVDGYRRRAASGARSPGPPRSCTNGAPRTGRCLRDLLLRLVESSVDGDPVPRRSPGAASSRPRARPSRRPARRCPARDQRRRHRRALARVARPRVAPPSRLARRRPGWPADPSPPLGRRRRRGLDGPPDTELYRGVRLRTTLEWRDAPILPSPRRNGTSSTTRRVSRRRGEARRRTRRGGASGRSSRGAAGGRRLRRAPGRPQAERADMAPRDRQRPRRAALARDADTVDQALLLAVEAIGLQDSGEPGQACSPPCSASRPHRLVPLRRRPRRVIPSSP